MPEPALNSSLTLRWPWWMHPAWALLLLTGTMALASIMLPDSVYEVWRTPKYITGDLALWLVIGVLVLFVGVIAASGAAARGGETTITFTPEQISFLRRAYRFMFFLVVAGYVIWIASGFIQGVRLADLLAVVDRQAGAISSLKGNARPIGGLTTITQFGPLVVAVGFLLRRLGVSGRGYHWLILLAGVRTVFYAERLALIEAALPLLLIASLTVGVASKRQRLVRSAPLVLGPAVWLVFAASEYARSWVYYQRTTDLPFIQWVTVRMIGYYTTSFNNSALLAKAHAGSYANPYFSIDGFWNMPGVSAFLQQGGINWMAADDWWKYILKNNGNPEFNNTGSFLVTYAEYGPLLMVGYWLAVGLIFGAMFTSLSKGSVPGLLAYSVFFVGLLELPRFIYWAQGRSVPGIIALVLIALMYPRTKAGGNTASPALPPAYASLSRSIQARSASSADH